jgi:hypothetical protein
MLLIDIQPRASRLKSLPPVNRIRSAIVVAANPPQSHPDD